MENNQDNKQGRDKKDSRKFSGFREAPEFDQKIIDLARVTRVMAGGKRMRFRACVAIGDKKGKFGIGLAKGADVSIAVNKAVNKAKKSMHTIPIVKGTIPHLVWSKYKAARVMLKPAPKGTGVKAGGAVRILLELAGVQDVVSKILGTNNKISNVRAFVQAVSLFRKNKIKSFVAKTKEEKPEVKKETKKEEVK